jgi:hypothetical protein
MTDEHRGYIGINQVYQHETVRHAAGEYGRGRFHTNGIEGAWSHFKRQVYGIHHWISEKHTDLYLCEFAWRYNRREADEAERVNMLLDEVGGRLRYKDLIGD